MGNGWRRLAASFLLLSLLFLRWVSLVLCVCYNMCACTCLHIHMFYTYTKFHIYAITQNKMQLHVLPKWVARAALSGHRQSIYSRTLNHSREAQLSSNFGGVLDYCWHPCVMHLTTVELDHGRFWLWLKLLVYSKISFICFSGFCRKKFISRGYVSPDCSFFNYKKSSQAYTGQEEFLLNVLEADLGSIFIVCQTWLGRCLIEPRKHFRAQVRMFCFKGFVYFAIKN